MSNSETDETAQADAHTVEAVVEDDQNMPGDLPNIGQSSPVPDRDPHRLFLQKGSRAMRELEVAPHRETYSSGVVHRCEQHEGWVGNSFEGAADDPQSGQSRKVLRNRLKPRGGNDGSGNRKSGFRSEVVRT